MDPMLRFIRRRAQIKPEDPALGNNSLPAGVGYPGAPHRRRFSHSKFDQLPLPLAFLLFLVPLFVGMSLCLLLDLAMRPFTATPQHLTQPWSGEGWSWVLALADRWGGFVFVLGVLALLIAVTLVVVWLTRSRPLWPGPVPALPPSGDVVRRTAKILDEEIKAGIDAAMEMKTRLEERKVATAGDRIVPWERATHDLYSTMDAMSRSLDVLTKSLDVDAMSRSLETVTQSLDAISQSLITVARNLDGNGRMRGTAHPTAQGEQASGFGNGTVPAIWAPTEVKAGESTILPLNLENTSNEPTPRFRLVGSSLVSEMGQEIPADAFRFEPADLVIEPNGTHEVAVTIRVPSDKPPGVYTGLIQSTTPGQFQRVVTIRIAQEG